MAPFVDCSSNNGAIDVDAYAGTPIGKLRRRPRWFSRKVSEGDGYHWEDGDRYSGQAHRHGLHVIHYHWLRPDSRPNTQARFFTDLVRHQVRPGDVIMCDYEATSGAHDPDPKARAIQLVAFMDAVDEALPGVPAIVYTGNWYVDGKAPMIAAVKRYPVVLADYSHRKPPNPHGFRVVAHQFSDRFDFAGFPAPADANRWRIDPERLFHFRRHR